MNPYQRFITMILVVTILPSLALMGALYCYDPLRLFHRMPDEPIRVVPDLRQQAMSFIRYADYESVILGTSMLENSSADQASELLGEKVINLSLSGSIYAVREYPLRKILDERPIKTVIYSIDFTYWGEFEQLAVDYLYNNYRLDDFAVYLNKKYLRCLLKWSDSDDCRGVVTTLDKPRNWQQYPFFMALFGGASQWAAQQSNPQIAETLKNWQTAVQAKQTNHPITLSPHEAAYRQQYFVNMLDNSFIRYVEKYPNTRFIAVVPPYYIAAYAQWAQAYPARFERYLNTLDFLVEQAEQLPNLTIYAFVNQPYADDIANYKDEFHYHPDFNAQMMRDIAQNRHRLTKANFANFVQTLRDRANQFDLIGNYEKFFQSTQ